MKARVSRFLGQMHSPNVPICSQKTPEVVRNKAQDVTESALAVLDLVIEELIWLRKCGQVLGLSLGGKSGDQEVFELKRGKVAQSRMEALRVVKSLDIIKEHGLGMLEVKGCLVMEALGFQGSPKAFHRGIVVTAASVTHTGQDLMRVEQLTEGACGILHTAIRVMNLGAKGPELYRTLKGLGYKAGS
jgi:hypothetical protein